MAIDNHTFCWNGIVSANVDQTLAFFPEVLGWKVIRADMGGEEVTMLAGADAPLAHVRGPAMEGEPSWWNNYLRVEDVDAAAAAVVAHGGAVVVPPTDIVPGRFATVTTPSGAYFSLFHESAEDDSAAGAGIHWVDLHSKDLDADLAFLREALGLNTAEFPMPNGAYHILEPETATRAGAMAGQHPEAPSMWMAWAEVDDVDATLDRARKHGGQVVAEPWDAPTVGRLAIVSDPAGVVFGVITPPAS